MEPEACAAIFLERSERPLWQRAVQWRPGADFLWSTSVSDEQVEVVVGDECAGRGMHGVGGLRDERTMRSRLNRRGTDLP